MSASMNIWIQDFQGQTLKGSSSIQNREDSSDVYKLFQGVTIPHDSDTGKLTGVRKHTPFTFVKAIDAITPSLLKACASGETLKSVKLSLYHITEQGQEKEYFRYLVEDAKVISITPVASASVGQKDLEMVRLMFNKITWSYIDGNIESSDQWAASA